MSNNKITLTATKPPHMRGIKQAIEEIKQADPYTALTEPALRRLIISKEIPSVRVGTKYLSIWIYLIIIYVVERLKANR